MLRNYLGDEFVDLGCVRHKMVVKSIAVTIAWKMYVFIVAWPRGFVSDVVTQLNVVNERSKVFPVQKGDEQLLDSVVFVGVELKIAVEKGLCNLAIVL
jgi:hypothetical protein